MKKTTAKKSARKAPARKASAKLATYRAKRDFTRTQEPSGEREVVAAEHRRFVIQKHAASHLHWDLRLELNGVFKSWAVTKGPSVDPADKRLAVEVEDHPLDYGDFEGTIPKGEYGGGTVQMWDRGYWAPQGSKKPEDALRSGDFKFVLVGERLKGSFVLVRIRNNRGRDTRTNWLLIKHQDEYAQPGGTPDLIAEDRSVASGRTMDQIARGVGKAPRPFMLAQAEDAAAVWHSNRSGAKAESSEREVDAKPKADAKPRARGGAKIRTSASATAKSRPQKTTRVKTLPDFIEPQLCKLVERPPAGAGYAHEIKFDGYRVQLRVAGGKAEIRTRSGLNWTGQFSAIAKAARDLPDAIIDGEICALDRKNMPSFALLQEALSEGRSEKLVFFAFDLLIEGKDDCRELPLTTRKQRLKSLLEAADVEPAIRYVEHFESTGAEVWQSACRMNLEGIISKRLDAPYVSGRHGGWTKAKCRGGREVVLGGWTTENGRFRSLLAGIHRNGRLEYIGRIGTGYGEAVASELLPALQKLTTDVSPFSGKDAPRKEANVRWLKPELVAEIDFAGWTGTNMIRHASFKGLRRDKSASEVVDERVESEEAADEESGSARPAAAKPAAKATRTHSAPPPKRTGPDIVMGVSISSASKVMWPESDAGAPVTKLEHAKYYEAVGEWMLPHLRGRPCSLVRAPDGINGEQFFQRHAMQGISDLFTLAKVRGDKAPYVQIDRTEALIAVAQIGALELHPWNCAEGDPEVAGRLVFDLDPAPEVKFTAVIAAALEVRERLAKVGLESFCKTTGGKGLHVVTPLTGGKDAVAWPAAKNFAHIICAQMAHDSPSKYLDTMSKKDRVGRIFLDYLRNDRTATAVAVLSTRARPGATVSMPIHWKDVKATLKPERYHIRTAPSILAKTRPWADYDRAARSLSAAIEKVLAKGRKAA